MGVHGFSQSLAKEGAKKNVKVNTIAPFAGTRMTETVFPKEVTDKIKPEYVAAFTAYLCHEDCPDTGALYEIGAGFYAKLRWQRTEGLLLPTSKVTPEAIRNGWEKVSSFEHGATFPTDNQELMTIISKDIEGGNTAEEELKAGEIFGMMHTYLAEGLGKETVGKVQSVYAFEITRAKGGKVEVVYEIDLKNG